jgi:type I restriction enzyme S subunit
MSADNSHYEKRNGREVCIDDELPFDIPDSWEWTRIGNIFNLQAGKFIQARKIYAENGRGRFPCFGGNGIRGYTEVYNRNGKFPLIGRQGALCGNINFASGYFYATEHAVQTS